MDTIAVPAHGTIRGRFLGIYGRTSKDGRQFWTATFGIGSGLVGSFNPDETTAKVLEAKAEGIIGRMFEITGVKSVTPDISRAPNPLTGAVEETPVTDKSGSVCCKIRATQRGQLYTGEPAVLGLRLLPREQSVAVKADLSALADE